MSLGGLKKIKIRLFITCEGDKTEETQGERETEREIERQRAF